MMTGDDTTFGPEGYAASNIATAPRNRSGAKCA